MNKTFLIRSVIIVAAWVLFLKTADCRADTAVKNPPGAVNGFQAAWQESPAAGAAVAVRLPVLSVILQEEGTSPGRDIWPLLPWLVMLILLAGLFIYILVVVTRRQVPNKEDLRETELKMLYEYAPCGFFFVNTDGYFVNMNKVFLEWLGYGRDEMVGKMRFTEICHDDDHTYAERMGALLGKNVAKTEFRLLKKSGELLPAVVSMVRGPKSGDERSLRLFCVQDNARCHEAMERIRNLDQELEAFSYSISHDLRAPLRSIDGYSQILQEDYASNLDDEGKRVLKVIMNNAKRMGKLIDDLLDFGRLGRKNLQLTKVNMSAIARAAAEELQAEEPQRKVNIKIEDLHPSPADADMMRLVWHNLLENAFKYTGKKELATIHVRSSVTAEGERCYQVEDNGVGFDMKYAPKLFGIFQRLHKIQDFSGTGVGLAIVKRIVSRHGGRVWAEASLEKGATFYFTLPMEDENT